MNVELVMPRAGLTMVEGTIGAWSASEGDVVKKGDVIMEFENEKNTIEFSCTHDGFLHITARPGDVIAVGAPIGVICETEAEYKALVSAPSDAPVVAPAAAPVPAVAPEGAKAPHGPDSPCAPESRGRIRITGLARKMARQHGIALEDLHGTGPGGRIIALDVKDYLACAKPQTVSVFHPGPQLPEKTLSEPGDTIQAIPLSGIRRAIAKNMYSSLQEMAQCTAGVEVDVTDLLALRASLVAQQDFLGAKITVNDLLSLAVVKMLKKHPLANATFDGETISCHSRVHLAVAVAADAGLMVPVVKNADCMSLVELHHAIADLARRARDKKLLDGEQSGATFTVSNVGVFSIDWTTPIINPPQVAIMGFGRAVKKMVPVNDEPQVRSMMNVFLTFDHRVFDGLEVGHILDDMKVLLECPALITL